MSGERSFSSRIFAAGHGHRGNREETVRVRLLGKEDAVRVRDDRSGELGELALLLLPRVAVVAGEVRVLAENFGYMCAGSISPCV